MSGETTMPGTVEIVERAFGVPAVEEYGSAEGGVMAIEFPDRVLRAREDIALIETVPTGNSDGMYEIVVTPFTNPAFPLFRYRTGDITHRPLDTSVEGFAHLERILGREDDFLRTATGAWVHPIDVYRLFAGPYQSTVRMFRVRQGRKGDLTVWVEGRPHMQVDYDGIRDLLGHMVGGWPVRVLPVKRMPTNPTGKQRPIASEMTESTAVTR